MCPIPRSLGSKQVENNRIHLSLRMDLHIIHFNNPKASKPPASFGLPMWPPRSTEKPSPANGNMPVSSSAPVHALPQRQVLSSVCGSVCLSVGLSVCLSVFLPIVSTDKQVKMTMKPLWAPNAESIITKPVATMVAAINFPHRN